MYINYYYCIYPLAGKILIRILVSSLFKACWNQSERSILRPRVLQPIGEHLSYN